MDGSRFEIDDDSFARAASSVGPGTGTSQLVIARRGELVVDVVVDPQPVDVYAVQKGLVSAMFGIAEERGLLLLDDAVSATLGAGWTQLPRVAEERLTIRRVLDMTTGMDDELRPLGEVGATWRYNNIAYNYLKTVLETVTDRTLAEVTDEWLLEPLGMAATRWVERAVFRPDGRPVTGLLSTARDLIRFGAMVLAGGDGIVPSDHVASFGRPGSDENPAWGLCWWSNDQPCHRLPGRESERRDGSLIPDAPADMIVARGAIENRLYVVPSLDLVVAHTATPVGGERPPPFDHPFWEVLTGANRSR